LDSIIVASLIIGDSGSGAITVDGVSAANNLFTLNSGNSIAINGPSTFSDVIINADGDINANVIVNDRDFEADADNDNSGAGDFNLAGGTSVNANQDITVTAVNINNANGGFNNFNAGGTVTLNGVPNVIPPELDDLTDPGENAFLDGFENNLPC